MDDTERRDQHAAQQRAYLDRHPEQYEKARLRSRAWRASNRERHRASVREWEKAHPRRYDSEQHHRWHLTARGLTQDEYDHLLARQGGVCFFCGKPETANRRASVIRRLSIDHDHETNQVRGLLCLGCNISLGYFERGMKSRLDPSRVELYLGGSWF